MAESRRKTGEHDAGLVVEIASLKKRVARLESELESLKELVAKRPPPLKPPASTKPPVDKGEIDISDIAELVDSVPPPPPRVPRPGRR